MITFERPWVLLLLTLLPLLAWRLGKRKYSSVLFTQPSFARKLPISWKQRCAGVPTVLRFTGLLLAIVCAAGPFWDAIRTRNISNSIGIQLVVDRSSSMTGDTLMYEGTSQTRLDVVKRVSLEFVFGNGRDLKGRPADMVGMVAFAAHPVTLCPLTLAHDSLRQAMDSLSVATGDEDGTAIGDALALAAARFKTAGEETARLKSRAIVLITDGDNNLGSRTPEQAARLAKEWGVRIYVIGIRRSWGRGVFEGDVVNRLNLLAAETGGIVRIATDGAALRSIYADIDRLERTELNVFNLDRASMLPTVLALAALACIVLEVVLNQTWLRRIPE